MKFLAEQVIKEMKAHPFTMVSVLALMLVAFWGWASYAIADDVDHRFIELAKTVEDNGEAINDVKRLLLAESIRSMQRQICATADESVRAQLRVTLDTIQEEYSKANGNRGQYPVGDCA